MSQDPLYWLPADFWNEEILGRRTAALTPVSGAHCQLQKFPNGTLISFDSSTEWRHPWFTDPQQENGQWMAAVRPGFVNGVPALVPGKDAQWLTDEPRIPLAFRTVGVAPGDPVPAFFKSLGVTLQTGPIINTSGELATIQDGPQNAVRSLVAADLYLSVARATYALSTTVSGNLVTGQLVDYAVTYDETLLRQYGSTPRLRMAPLMPDVRHLSLEDRLSGTLADDGEDRQLVSTVYLLSPENPESDTPDASWTPFVRHFLFWNVSHAARNQMPVNVQSNPITPSLAFFVGQYTFAPVATQGAMDALVQSSLEELYNTTGNEGKYWT